MAAALVHLAVLVALLAGLPLLTSPAGTVVASAAPAGVEKCGDAFERIADPDCVRMLPQHLEEGLAEGLDHSIGKCIVTAFTKTDIPSDQIDLVTGACTARMAALERERAMNAIGDPESDFAPGQDVTTAESCAAAGVSMGLSSQDANLACGLRFARRAEAEANRALETIRQINEQRDKEQKEQGARDADARKSCEQLVGKVQEMSSAMFTPRWDQLGGDAEWAWIESQVKELDCQRVLNLR